MPGNLEPQHGARGGARKVHRHDRLLLGRHPSLGTVRNVSGEVIHTPLVRRERRRMNNGLERTLTPPLSHRMGEGGVSTAKSILKAPVATNALLRSPSPVRRERGGVRVFPLNPFAYQPS